MPTDHILALLIAERDKLNAAIAALQGPAKRRGRPPKSGGTFYMPYSSRRVPEPTPKKRGRKFSAAQRAAAAERMRLRWAAKRKAEAKSARQAK